MDPRVKPEDERGVGDGLLPFGALRVNSVLAMTKRVGLDPRLLGGDRGVEE
jgi:hypothetical protein